MNVSQQIKQRWRWGHDSRFARQTDQFETVLTFIGAPATKRNELMKGGRYTEGGIRDELKTWAGKGYARRLKKIAADNANSRKAIEAERNALTKVTTDPSDTIGFLLRQEIRAHLRGMNNGDRMAALMGEPDPRFVTAALEAPGVLSGLTDETQRQVELDMVRRNANGKVESLEDEDSAAEQLAAATQIAMDELQSVTGMQDSEFKAWMESIPTE